MTIAGTTSGSSVTNSTTPRSRFRCRRTTYAAGTISATLNVTVTTASAQEYRKVARNCGSASTTRQASRL